MTFLAAAGADLNRWDLLIVLLVVFVGIVGALAVAGRRAARSDAALDADPLLWIPAALERLTGIAGWAAGMIGTAAYGLLIAGIGFYNDVAWHVGKGRDKDLFTAPHTMIIVGLGFIALAAAVGIVFATAQRMDTSLRIGALRVPWSAVPLGLLGVCALGGFPLDDLWHATYGIDVTMWSPTHMLMICGASFSLIAAWLCLAEAGVRPGGNRWAKGVHFLAAFFVLGGLGSALGEFRYGVPQFQQVFHPILLLLGGAFAFVPTRLVLGRGWAVVLALVSFLPTWAQQSAGLESSFVPTRMVGLYITSAIAVELAAALLGTDRRLRFAVASAAGVATIGLAGEWAWNASALQPWKLPLLAPALVLGSVAALGGAILGAAYGGAVAREPGRLARGVLIGAAVAVVVVIVVPLRRDVGDVTAAIELQRIGDTASVTVRLDPPSAADDNKWFQVVAWQGDGARAIDLHRSGPGTWVADAPVPIGGRWKVLLRLHRGNELMAAPIYLPADPEIGAPEIPAESRTIAMGSEQQYLMREVKPGPATVQNLAYVVIAAVVVLWAGAFVLACTRIPARPPLRREGSPRPPDSTPASGPRSEAALATTS